MLNIKDLRHKSLGPVELSFTMKSSEIALHFRRGAQSEVAETQALQLAVSQEEALSRGEVSEDVLLDRPKSHVKGPLHVEVHHSLELDLAELSLPLDQLRLEVYVDQDVLKLEVGVEVLHVA